MTSASPGSGRTAAISSEGRSQHSIWEVRSAYAGHSTPAGTSFLPHGLPFASPGEGI